MNISTRIHKYLTFFIIALPLFSNSQIPTGGIKAEKQTLPGLYVTAKEAYNQWKNSDGKIIILDVRTAEEYIFVGHAPMAWIIPAFIQSYKWDDVKQKFPMIPNPEFITEVMKVANKNDTIMVMCRSGGRSALAVNILAKEGFTNVYNIIDGMEGDTVQEPESLFYGQHLVNGWKNSGLPWTYDPDPKKMRIPQAK